MENKKYSMCGWALILPFINGNEFTMCVCVWYVMIEFEII